MATGWKDKTGNDHIMNALRGNNRLSRHRTGSYLRTCVIELSMVFYVKQSRDFTTHHLHLIGWNKQEVEVNGREQR